MFCSLIVAFKKVISTNFLDHSVLSIYNCFIINAINFVYSIIPKYLIKRLFSFKQLFSFAS